jgi:glycosyltransferase involved in cell wall biosynthesis
LDGPLLSIVVICHNMRREAPRTLHSLSRGYQQGIDDLDYEVLAVDNGSDRPLDPDQVRAFGPEFDYHFHATSSPSPVAALNAAVRRSRGRYVVICIDGARILSPGMLRFMALATRLAPAPVIGSLAWHLGEKVQKLAMLEGYDREVEDRLLAGSGWERDGYRLFGISCLANSSRDGWFQPIAECNCVGVSRETFEALGGFDERFVLAGGGLANLDFYKRACEWPGTQLITLLGEGTFHQFHGGAATNARPEVHPGEQFSREYQALRGEPFRKPTQAPIYLGTLPPQAAGFMRLSAGKA